MHKKSLIIIQPGGTEELLTYIAINKSKRKQMIKNPESVFNLLIILQFYKHFLTSRLHCISFIWSDKLATNISSSLFYVSQNHNSLDTFFVG